MQSVSFIVCNISSIILLEGNLAETGLIGFMTRNFQSSTYLKTDCWKPHKVPSTLASSKKSMHTCCLLIACCTFFSLSRSFLNFSFYCCLSVAFNNISFSFFLSFLSPNIPLYFSPSIFLGIPSIFENQASPFWINCINIYTINLQQISYTAGMITPQPHQKQKEFSESFQIKQA